MARSETVTAEEVTNSPTGPTEIIDFGIPIKVRKPRKPRDPATIIARTNIMLALPVDLGAKVSEVAAAEGIGNGAWARNLVAAHFAYVLPTATIRARGKKYATKELRDAAQARQRALTKAVLAALKAGKLDLAALGLGDLSLD